MRPPRSLAFAALVACGGTIDPQYVADTDAGDAGARSRTDDGGGNGFHDPSCVDAGPPRTIRECDIQDPVRSCEAVRPGTACYPVAIPPQASCEPETYGTACLPSGTGGQGTACGGQRNCAPGFVCLITGGDTQCAELCALGKKGACPTGLVCSPIDVPGFAACL
jgi:hypothetical protein